MDSIVAKSINNRTVRIEAICIPPDIETRVRIDAGQLETGFSRKLVIRDSRGDTGTEKLLTALKRTLAVTDSTGDVELRWGLTIYDESGNRAGAFYFNSRGDRGVVGTVRVTYNGPLFQWLHARLSNCE